MKVALIGNMNNNNFSIMRYFRDLGVDAHLLLWSDDGAFSSSHFGPESDTWNIAKWDEFIHRTRIANGITPALDFPLSWVTSFLSNVRRIFNRNAKPVNRVSRQYLIDLFSDYDFLIGSGNVPAICLKAGIKLDIFMPYSIGVEYINNDSANDALSHRNPFVRFVMSEMVKKQLNGLKNTRFILNAEVGLTQETLNKANLSSIPLAMPMVYDNEILPDHVPSDSLRKAAKTLSESSISIFHHARLMWTDSTNADESSSKSSKNNHWLLLAFSEFVALRPALNPVLIIVEYGPDVAATKSLACELGIADKVYWMPKMPRREVMWLLSRATVGVGEFYDAPKMIWGGTGWEALASGKPLLQGFNFEAGEFERLYGHPPPPMLPIRKRDDILTHLLRMADDIGLRDEVGRGAKQWFSQYNGIGLARRWLELLQVPFECPQEKSLLTQFVNK